MVVILNLDDLSLSFFFVIYYFVYKQTRFSDSLNYRFVMCACLSFLGSDDDEIEGEFNYGSVRFWNCVRREVKLFCNFVIR